MNFNLDITRLFRLLKGNLNGIKRYSLSIMLCYFVIAALLVFNIGLYKSSINIVYPIILSVILSFLIVVGALYFTGLNYEIIHNLIEEEDGFMPLVKGRFKEYMIKGGKAILCGVPFFMLALIIFFALVLLYQAYNNVYIELLTFVVIFFVITLFVSFFMAYAYTFKVKSVFDKNNFKIFLYAMPEFIYSYVLAQIFYFVTSILFVLAFISALIVIALIAKALSFAIGIFGAKILFMILTAIISIFAIILAFVINAITTFYTFSLNAQSFNYGKYFLCMGEAPKRRVIEYIIPIVIAILIYLSNSYISHTFDNIKAKMYENSSNYSIQFDQKAE